METSTYQGEELALFAAARNWKSYWSDMVRPFLGRDVLEVGAGLGANTEYLAQGHRGRWVCLEPDPALAARIPTAADAGDGLPAVEARIGCLRDMPADERFDSILYIDVLEHIEDDREELAAALGYLRPGGTLIVLVPALPVLFSPFDAALGHYRRYTAGQLREIGPAGAHVDFCAYLDLVGIAASFSNRFFLRRRRPSPWQIQCWDRCMIPLSRRIDPLLGYPVGKSVLTVWRAGD